MISGSVAMLMVPSLIVSEIRPVICHASPVITKYQSLGFTSEVPFMSHHKAIAMYCLQATRSQPNR